MDEDMETKDVDHTPPTQKKVSSSGKKAKGKGSSGKGGRKN